MGEHHQQGLKNNRWIQLCCTRLAGRNWNAQKTLADQITLRQAALALGYVTVKQVDAGANPGEMIKLFKPSVRQDCVRHKRLRVSIVV